MIEIKDKKKPQQCIEKCFLLLAMVYVQIYVKIYIVLPNGISGVLRGDKNTNQVR